MIKHYKKNLKITVKEKILNCVPNVKVFVKKYLDAITWHVINVNINGVGYVNKNIVLVILIN